MPHHVLDGYGQRPVRTGDLERLHGDEVAQPPLDGCLNGELQCGGHFRTESQTPEGEALRDDSAFSYVAAWEHASPPVLHREELRFDSVEKLVRQMDEDSARARAALAAAPDAFPKLGVVG